MATLKRGIVKFLGLRGVQLGDFLLRLGGGVDDMVYDEKLVRDVLIRALS